MAFNFDSIQSVEFGVCLTTSDGEDFRIVPSDSNVQDALIEMLDTTRLHLNNETDEYKEFSPAEKYASTEKLRLPLDSEYCAKHLDFFNSENLTTDVNGLSHPDDLISYFAIFRDSSQNKLVAFRRAAQFKGVVKKNMMTVIDGTVQLLADRVFKLDTDFDFLIYDQQVLVWRPSSFVFVSELDEQIHAASESNVSYLESQVSCVSFVKLKEFIGSHKLSMRLVAAIKSRNDLSKISKKKLKSQCKAAGLSVLEKDGVLYPQEGSEYGFLMLLDRRRYSVTLIENQPEIYEASSRHTATPST